MFVLNVGVWKNQKMQQFKFIEIIFFMFVFTSSLIFVFMSKYATDTYQFIVFIILFIYSSGYIFFLYKSELAKDEFFKSLFLYINTLYKKRLGRSLRHRGRLAILKLLRKRYR